MKRDLPDDLHALERFETPSRSLLASRVFWMGGAMSVAVWAALLMLLA